MQLISKFDQLNKEDVLHAGGKGASLGEMTQAGIPVPPGFVVLSQTFDLFLKENDLQKEIDRIINSIAHGEVHDVELASEKIKSLILSQSISESVKVEIQKYFDELGAEYVAVRSSATVEDGVDHAWAGQLESYLNVTKGDVFERIQHCWASLFTSRAIFYRFEKGLEAVKISVAVVIQKMVESEISGVAFSVHPVTEDQNQILIEAVLGLGEAIVSGAVIPDAYVVSKKPLKVSNIYISQQTRALYKGGWKELEDEGMRQVLSEKQILELSKLIIQIEDHYGFPCDIEWVFYDDKFYVVQSRPITTLVSGNEKRVVLKKYLARDVTLIFVQLINKIENKLSKEKSSDTYLVHARNDGLVSYYYNDDILNLESSDNRSEKMKVGENKKLIRRVYDVAAPLKELWNKPQPLSMQELQTYISEFEVLYELHNQVNFFDDEDRKVRIHLEGYTAGVNMIIRKTISHLYPFIEDYVDVVTLEEILSGQFPDIKELEQRNAGYFYVNSALNLLSKEEFERIYHVILKDEVPKEIENNSIKGNIAYKGVVQGRVKIIQNHKDISTALKKQTEPFILVSTMTSPDFLPLMNYVLAIVTDEGGVTCHAAITARELKIPCMVGTQIATKILKDGDMVEVDAESGIIKIL